MLSLGMVSDISMYLDKNYVVKEKLKSIKECGQLLFKKTILKNLQILTTYQDIIFNQIENERNGEIIQHEVIRKSLKILIEIGIKSTNVY